MTSPATCARCKQVHNKCTAHRRDGQPCGQYPMHDQQVCKMHGGMAGQAKQAAKKRGVLREAQAHFALPIDVEPAQALLDEVHRTAGVVKWLESKVNDVAATAEKTEPEAPHPLVWGITEIKDKTGFEFGVAVTKKSQPSVWYELWLTERKHLVAVCKAALDAGIERRRIELAEKQGELLAGAIRAILNDLNLNQTQQQLVATVVPRHLRAITN